MFQSPPLTELEPVGLEHVALTDKHIKHGQVMDCVNCPVALALCYHFKKRVKVTFTISVINKVKYTNSPNLSSWITQFDVKRKVTPIKLLVDHDNKTVSIA